MEHRLTQKQKAFCEEYLIDLNATQAAIRAGYKEKAAGYKITERIVFLDMRTGKEYR